MTNVWVGTDYYIPSIDQSGDRFKVQVSSTTTSNTYVCETDKDSASANTEAVGAASIVWLDGLIFGNSYFGVSSDDSRRTTIGPSSTTSENGTGLEVEYAIAANGHCNTIYSDNFDQMLQANNYSWHVKVGGTGWEEQDQIRFTNISSGFPDGATSEQFHDFIGTILWTDKNGPCFSIGTPEVDLASNATFLINAAIRAGTWTP